MKKQCINKYSHYGRTKMLGLKASLSTSFKPGVLPAPSLCTPTPSPSNLFNLCKGSWSGVVFHVVIHVSRQAGICPSIISRGGFRLCEGFWRPLTCILYLGQEVTHIPSAATVPWFPPTPGELQVQPSGYWEHQGALLQQPVVFFSFAVVSGFDASLINSVGRASLMF